MSIWNSVYFRDNQAKSKFYLLLEFMLDDDRIISTPRNTCRKSQWHRSRLQSIPFLACWRYLASKAPMLALWSLLASSRGRDFRDPADGARECRWCSVRLCSSSTGRGFPLCEPRVCCPKELTESTARNTQMHSPLYIAGEKRDSGLLHHQICYILCRP